MGLNSRKDAGVGLKILEGNNPTMKYAQCCSRLYVRPYLQELHNEVEFTYRFSCVEIASCWMTLIRG